MWISGMNSPAARLYEGVGNNTVLNLSLSGMRMGFCRMP